MARNHQRTQHHGGDQGYRVSLKQVSGHTGAIAHVVAHVVGDHGGVTRVIFRNIGFDFAHQVSTNVCAFGENAASQTREDRDQRGTESKTHQGLQYISHRHRFAQAVRRGRNQHEVEAGYAQQPQAYHQHAGDCAAPESDVQGFVQTLACSLRRAHVGAHRNVHADVACQAGEHRADEEARCRHPADKYADHNQQHHSHHGNGAVLAVQIGFSALLNRRRDGAHTVVAIGQRQNSLGPHRTKTHGNQAADQREHQSL